MKIVKRVVISILVFLCIVFIVAIVKNNVELNTYINQKTKENSKENIRPEIHGTEVHVVGTVHFETENIKRSDLYNLIDSIAPSVILFEGNEDAVQRILNKTDYFFQFLRAFRKTGYMEKAVVLKYIDKYPECVILPYEWEIREQFHRKHKIRSKPIDMFNAIIKLENQDLLTEEQSFIINKYLELSRELNKIGQLGSLAEINNSRTDSLVGERQFFQYTKNTQIVKERKELAEYISFAQINEDYWDTRNKAMAQNILNQIKLNPNKVIVVLNGFYHRYYLIDELKKYERELKFTVKGI